MANDTIINYLEQLKGWLGADIIAYKKQFSSSITRNPSDRTRSPDSLPSTALPDFQKEIGLMTIPIAISCLAAIEFIGFCLGGNPADKGKTLLAVSLYYRTVNTVLLSKPTLLEIKELVNGARHGMAHKFFLKNRLSIGYFNYSNNLFLPFSDGNALNVSVLFDHFEQGISYILSRTDLHPSMDQCYTSYLLAYE